MISQNQSWSCCRAHFCKIPIKETIIIQTKGGVKGQWRGGLSDDKPDKGKVDKDVATLSP